MLGVPFAPLVAGVPLFSEGANPVKVVESSAAILRILVVQARMIRDVFAAIDQHEVFRPVVAVVMIDVVDVVAVWDFCPVMVITPDFAVEVVNAVLFVVDAGDKVAAVGFVVGVWVAAKFDATVDDGFGACHEVSCCPCWMFPNGTHSLLTRMGWLRVPVMDCPFDRWRVRTVAAGLVIAAAATRWLPSGMVM